VTSSGFHINPDIRLSIKFESWERRLENESDPTGIVNPILYFLFFWGGGYLCSILTAGNAPTTTVYPPAAALPAPTLESIRIP
jgi:hypothetical protein